MMYVYVFVYCQMELMIEEVSLVGKSRNHLHLLVVALQCVGQSLQLYQMKPENLELQ